MPLHKTARPENGGPNWNHTGGHDIVMIA